MLLALKVRDQFKVNDSTLILIGPKKYSRGVMFTALRDGGAIKVSAPEAEAQDTSSQRRQRLALDMLMPFGKHGKPSAKHPNAPGLTVRQIIDTPDITEGGIGQASYFEFLCKEEIMGPDLLDDETFKHLQEALTLQPKRRFR